MIRTGVARTERLEGGRLAELYARHSRDAIKLAYLLTGDRALAEDLAQDAFVRLAGRFLDLRDPRGFESYLRRTIVNLSRMHFRHQKVERTHLDSTSKAEPSEPDLGTRELLRDALFKLPERQRSALVLRFYLDLSEAQTAELLKCRAGTVKSLVSRGLETLRKEVLDV